MMVFVASAWAAPSVVVDVPFPSRRVFDDTPDRVCLTLEYRGKATSSKSQMSDFDVDCIVDKGRMSVCLTLLSPDWPTYVPPVQCGNDEDLAVRMRPKRAYDPTEDIWDGVAIVQGVMLYKAAYRVPKHPDVPGIMNQGKCGITDELFWFETRNPNHRQSCILVMEDQSERTIPIRLVQRLQRLGN
ncbi:MAG: hypothetical protein AAGA48_14330 [Myxococcota bacterium]